MDVACQAPPLSPGVCSHSCPLNWSCFLTVSSFATPFSFYHQSFPVAGSFPMSRLFAFDGESIRASATVLPVNIQGLFPLGLTGLICLQSKGPSRVFSSTTIQKHQFFLRCSAFFLVQISHPYMTTKKNPSFAQTFVSKVMSLLLNMLSRFVTAFLPRSECLLILWLRSLSAVILEPKKIKCVTASTSPFCLP